MRVEAFDQVGGYETRLRAGEEPEMTARMRAAGWKIWRIDARMTEHDAKILTLRQWWQRTQRGGYGYAQAWTASKGLPQRLYGRNLRSAFVWAGAIPLVIILAAVALKTPAIILALPLIYALQFVRIASRDRNRGRMKWITAGMLLLAKFPEAIGACRYFIHGRDHAVPEYKSNG